MQHCGLTSLERTSIEEIYLKDRNARELSEDINTTDRNVDLAQRQGLRKIRTALNQSTRPNDIELAVSNTLPKGWGSHHPIWKREFEVANALKARLTEVKNRLEPDEYMVLRLCYLKGSPQTYEQMYDASQGRISIETFKNKLRTGMAKLQDIVPK